MNAPGLGAENDLYVITFEQNVAKEEILINVTPHETRVAVVENGIVQELHLERADARSIVGNLYKGKVLRVLPGMQSAFIDIGLEKNGFLAAADIAKPKSGTTQNPNSQTVPIENQLYPGQAICVRVIKDPSGSKGARLGTELSIASRHLVFLPKGDEIAVSQKIDNLEERARLKMLVAGLAIEHALEGGLIIRTLAESKQHEDLVNDCVFLKSRWDHLCKAMQQAKPGSLVYEDSSLTLRTLRDWPCEDLASVRIDSRDSVEKARQFASNFVPGVAEKIEDYADKSPLFGLYSVEQQIQDALQRKVSLKSGGNLIIDQTDAMTTIDVNTGSYVGQFDPQNTVLKTNLEAAGEIAHQIRLRNTAGIIVVDFIDMASSRHQHKVLQALQQALARDRVKTHITQMSALGLVEITRKRTRQSLQQLMCETCPVCEGQSRVKTVQTICYEILREITRENFHYKAHTYTIIASQAVIDLLHHQEAHSLTNLQALIKRPIVLQVDPYYQQQQYDIALN